MNAKTIIKIVTKYVLPAMEAVGAVCTAFNEINKAKEHAELVKENKVLVKEVKELTTKVEILVNE